MGERLIYQVRGSGFLKHMVRNLVGTLIEAGRGNIADMTALPGRCGPTAPPRVCFWLVWSMIKPMRIALLILRWIAGVACPAECAPVHDFAWQAGGSRG